MQPDRTKPMRPTRRMGLVTAAFGFTLLYAWEVLGSEPAGNVLVFCIWVIAFLSLLVLIASGELKQISPKPSPWRMQVMRWLDFTFVLALVALGHWVLGLVWLLSHIFCAVAASKFNDDGSRVVKGASNAA